MNKNNKFVTFLKNENGNSVKKKISIVAEFDSIFYDWLPGSYKECFTKSESGGTIVM